MLGNVNEDMECWVDARQASNPCGSRHEFMNLEVSKNSGTNTSCIESHRKKHEFHMAKMNKPIGFPPKFSVCPGEFLEIFVPTNPNQLMC